MQVVVQATLFDVGNTLLDLLVHDFSRLHVVSETSLKFREVGLKSQTMKEASNKVGNS